MRLGFSYLVVWAFKLGFRGSADIVVGAINLLLRNSFISARGNLSHTLC